MSSDLFIIALLLSYVNRYKLVGKSTRLGQCAAQIDNSVHFTKHEALATRQRTGMQSVTYTWNVLLQDINAKLYRLVG